MNTIAHKVVLNIGLEGCTIRDSNSMVIAVIRGIIGSTYCGGINIHRVPAVEGREETLVVEIESDFPIGRLMGLSIALGQDCIAYWNRELEFGLLVGPRPESYGGFQMQFFIMPEDI